MWREMSFHNSINLWTVHPNTVLTRYAVGGDDTDAFVLDVLANVGDAIFRVHREVVIGVGFQSRHLNLGGVETALAREVRNGTTANVTAYSVDHVTPSSGRFRDVPLELY